VTKLFKKFIHDPEGQDLVEYALLLVFLALAAITALPTLGQAVSNVSNSRQLTMNTLRRFGSAGSV
jgi:Flp pilus assembly pilin Flp